MAADWGILVRAIHVVAVVVWIGGVWLVTTVLLPSMKEKPPSEWIREFDAIEHRFAPQARIGATLVLLSGLYMLYRYDLWDRFVQGQFWWMHLMVGVWLVFAALLFFIEPFQFGRPFISERHWRPKRPSRACFGYTASCWHCPCSRLSQRSAVAMVSFESLKRGPTPTKHTQFRRRSRSYNHSDHRDMRA